MTDALSVFEQMLDADAVGWAFISGVIGAAAVIIVQWIRTNGEYRVAKETAAVSLNGQGADLVLQMVHALREEVTALKAANANMAASITREEKLCDHLIAILSAPDEIMREYQMVRAKEYLEEIGRWKN